MPFDIVIAVLMSCVMLWWVGRGMSWTTRLAVAAVTLTVIILVVLFEHSVIPGRE